MNCEMCGAQATTTALIEGVELNVCSKCAKFGNIVRKRAQQLPKVTLVSKPQKPDKEILQVIKDNYSIIIRQKRENLGLKQEEFAKLLAEKESLIHKIESGEYTPSLELARKIEKQLGIILIEQKEVSAQNLKAKDTTFTIGDIIKLRK
jgi:putative transcription factor